MDLPRTAVQQIVAWALQEDIGHGDITTLAVIPSDAHTEADFVPREHGVLAGLPVLIEVFAQVEPSIRVTAYAQDGDAMQPGQAIARVSGAARGMLTAERVALNLVQRMCGIATMTARYVAAIGDLPVGLLDTRKTTPGLRVLEKYAVRMGGGINHRNGLYDAIMLKDNHLALLRAQGIELAEALQRARIAVGPLVKIEVEVETVEEACAAAVAGADVILLDNMPPDAMREVVSRIGKQVLLEASGGITLDTIRSVAETGVDFISVGALTHSARALDIGLDFVS